MNQEKVKKINKRMSVLSRRIDAAKLRILKYVLNLYAYFLYLIDTNKKDLVVEKIDTQSNDLITMNLVGRINTYTKLEKVLEQLEKNKVVFEEADVTFASVKCKKKEDNLFSLYKIKNVLRNTKLLNSTIYDMNGNRIGLISYNRIKRSTLKRHRVLILKEIIKLKKNSVDFIILDRNNAEGHVINSNERNLYKLILSMGVDYAFGVTPQKLESGITSMLSDRSIARSINSLGTFIDLNKEGMYNTLILRLKLKKINGRLQVFEEAYHPFIYNDPIGLKNVTYAKKKNELDINALSNVQSKFKRLHPVNNILTLGKIMESINVELPDKYKYLEEFSVGKFTSNAAKCEPGDVYFCWRPYSDANDFDTYGEREKLRINAGKVVSKKVLFIISFTDLPINTPYIVVDDVLESHISATQAIRAQQDIKSIAVTGSVGKTSTKDMLCEVMSMKYNTTKSDKNGNTQMRISVNVQELLSNCDIYIQELGGGRPGGASRHSRMVVPNATVITNIGDAHIGNFNGDQLELAKSKLGIIEGMPEDGVLYVNGDDPILNEIEANCKKVTFAVNNKEADYYADNIQFVENSVYFDISYEDKRIPAVIYVPGEHNILNAVCSFAIGKQFGISDELIVKGISHFKTQGIRQNIVNVSGVTLFFDCFNSSSKGIESSIKTLANISIKEGGKRFAVLGDVTGLGELAEQTHKDIAEPLLENPADVFIFYGKDIKHTYEIVKNHGYECYYTSVKDNVIEWLEEMTKPGDVIMAKGSSKMQLEHILDCAFGTRTLDFVLLEENLVRKATFNDVTYNLFSTHATAVALRANSKKINIMKKVGAVDVTCIGGKFESTSAETISVPNTVIHIDKNVFRKCPNLKEVTGMENLKYIGDGAFADCTKLESINLPNSLKHLGDYAFQNCQSLKEVYIPENVAQISPTAFDGCVNLIVKCRANSNADNCLNEIGIKHLCS